MTSVRFLYTSQPGKGFEELISPEQQLKNWLRESLRQPNSGNVRYFDKGLGVTLQDGLVICSYLSRQLDDNKRPFIHNHSMLLAEVEYNRLAMDFGQSILAQIAEEDEDIIRDGQLKPFSIPRKTTNGLGEGELETLVNYRGWDLERLLASLIAGKAFSIQIKSAQEEAITLSLTLLKIAALGDLPVPQISTFEPNGKTRTWYPSQVLPTHHARLDVQFQPKEAPGKAATEQAKRLARVVENLDPDGIAHAVATSRNHAETAQRHSVEPEVSTPAREERNPEVSQARSSEKQRYQYNKDYEERLNARKGELETLRGSLDEWEGQIKAREEKVSQREKDVGAAEAQVKRKGARRDQWRHIEEIFGVLNSNDCPEPEDMVLSRFFDQLKNLEQDNLLALKDGVRDFLPRLKKIAELNASKKAIFLKDLETIEKKLEGKNPRWLF